MATSGKLFTRFVEPGRVGVIHYGPDCGKLCIIVDIINENRVLVDGGGATKVARQSMPIRRIALTDFKLKIPRGVRSMTLKKALEKDDVIAAFNNSAWGKKRIAKLRRQQMTDFERFKLMLYKKQQKSIMKTQLTTLKK